MCIYRKSCRTKSKRGKTDTRNEPLTLKKKREVGFLGWLKEERQRKSVCVLKREIDRERKSVGVCVCVCVCVCV
jgi:hypothetical protein